MDYNTNVYYMPTCNCSSCRRSSSSRDNYRRDNRSKCKRRDTQKQTSRPCCCNNCDCHRPPTCKCSNYDSDGCHNDCNSQTQHVTITVKTNN